MRTHDWMTAAAIAAVFALAGCNQVSDAGTGDSKKPVAAGGGDSSKPEREGTNVKVDTKADGGKAEVLLWPPASPDDRNDPNGPMDDNSDLFSMPEQPKPAQPSAKPAVPAAPVAREEPRPAPKGSDGSDYDASAIEVLEGLEPVRRRPGMYIGGTDEKALHHLFAEVIDNAMDEALAGHATFIEVEVGSDGSLTSTMASSFNRASSAARS